MTVRLKRYAGERITLSVEIRDDQGKLADPTSVRFKYRIGRDGDDRPDPIVTRTAEGQYSTTFDLPELIAGILYGTWVTEGVPVRRIPAVVPIYHPSGIQGLTGIQNLGPSHG